MTKLRLQVSTALHIVGPGNPGYMQGEYTRRLLVAKRRGGEPLSVPATHRQKVNNEGNGRYCPSCVICARRFFCQQASSCSVQIGRSFP